MIQYGLITKQLYVEVRVDASMLRTNIHVCRSCGSRFQLIKMPLTEENVQYCPYCGRATVEPPLMVQIN
jgi:predicted RNA-binding Zn-ribbon protein involved in translation (DUF1610 family)